MCFQLIYHKFKPTYNHENDKFRIEFVLVPAAGLAFLVNHHFEAIEILWTFSIYNMLTDRCQFCNAFFFFLFCYSVLNLEAIAIMPQLQMISDTGEAETITSHYLFFLGSYRALYLINWIWRFYYEGFYRKFKQTTLKPNFLKKIINQFQISVFMTTLLLLPAACKPFSTSTSFTCISPRFSPANDSNCQSLKMPSRVKNYSC